MAAKIAAALGYHYYDQTKQNDALWANAILSRYPIGKATPNDTGVEIDVDGRKVHVFNIHLDDSPYQPYQLLGIEYGDVALPEDGGRGGEGRRGDARPRASSCCSTTWTRRAMPMPTSCSAISTSPRTATGRSPR